MIIENLIPQEVKLVPLNKALSIVNNNIPGEFIVKNFYGHQYGVLIATLDENHKIIEDVLNIGEDLINVIIHNKDNVILSDEWFTTDLKKRNNIYLPYAVSDHSIFEPTINFDDIGTRIISEHSDGVEYYIEACIVLNSYKSSYNNGFIYNRYLNFKIQIPNDETLDKSLNIFNLYYMFLDNLLFKDSEVISIEMYDEVGKEVRLSMDKESILNNTNSLRLIQKTNLILVDNEILNEEGI